MPVEVKFHMDPPWDQGTKLGSNGLGHMTKMAAIPIYGKNIKNLLLWNQKADDLESCSIVYSSPNKCVQMMTLD